MRILFQKIWIKTCTYLLNFDRGYGYNVENQIIFFDGFLPSFEIEGLQILVQVKKNR